MITHIQLFDGRGTNLFLEIRKEVLLPGVSTDSGVFEECHIMLDESIQGACGCALIETDMITLACEI